LGRGVLFVSQLKLEFKIVDFPVMDVHEKRGLGVVSATEN
jgi:hypothetical protein